MGLILDRKDFLQRLLMVGPGLSKNKTVQQSSSVIFKKGRLYTLSQEIACSIISGLETDIEGSVAAETLTEVVKLLPDNEIDILVKGSILILKTISKKRCRLPLEPITLPIDEVERPDNKQWKMLDPDFADAVDLAVRCCNKANKVDEGFAKICVHMTPKWIESSDNCRAIRYRIQTFVKDPILIRGETIKCMCQLGMTKGQETEGWLHFRSPMGLRLSLRKHPVEHYPDQAELFKCRGRRIAFPKELVDAAQLAGLFENEGNVKIQMSVGKLTIIGENLNGEYSAQMKAEYKGKDVAFLVAPKLISELVARYSECELTDRTLRVDGGKFVFITALEMQP